MPTGPPPPTRWRPASSPGRIRRCSPFSGRGTRRSSSARRSPGSCRSGRCWWSPGRRQGRGLRRAPGGAGGLGIAVRAAAPREACAAADVIVTATPARAPLFEADWVRPGTHVAAMGADAKGKQELPPALLERAQLFCDLPEQSRTIGEFQHASAGASAACGPSATCSGRGGGPDRSGGDHRVRLLRHRPAGPDHRPGDPRQSRRALVGEAGAGPPRPGGGRTACRTGRSGSSASARATPST